ncbi:photoreceptor disk component PRCD [Danio rerio]|uniref:Photoreceptor disk component PRCD n=1 Tax=Danio rerio TaxID=7955 RepID=A0A8M2BIX3_DANRE|nr:progressive rod-cone degeneration protein [Danio rerio]|eukprot:XP_005171605.1 progressive rod-cone degeneration protein [Danio rerio]
MCTTIMVLSTIAVLLRRMFINRVKPQPDVNGTMEKPQENDTTDSQNRTKEL